MEILREMQSFLVNWGEFITSGGFMALTWYLITQAIPRLQREQHDATQKIVDTHREHIDQLVEREERRIIAEREHAKAMLAEVTQSLVAATRLD